MSGFTSNQQRAIEVRGNALVVAGAGAGKTRTLVERCLARVLDADDPVSIDDILMVTFTEAAAAEMRNRIGTALEKAVAAAREARSDEARLRWLEEQLALLDTARISTLHSFCLQLVREHFHELGLDPQLVVLDEPQAKLLAHDTLRVVLDGHYANRHPNSDAVQQLIAMHGRGWDKPVSDAVLQIHDYIRSLDDPKGWLDRQLAMFRDPQPTQWHAWLEEGVGGWKTGWLESLALVPEENAHARRCAEALEKLPAGATRAQIIEVLQRVAEQNDFPRGTASFRKPLEKLFEEVAFLESNLKADDDTEPLAQDWEWVRGHMVTLLELVAEFGETFAATKREQGALDFADQEQFTLEILWDRAERQPTASAREWQERLWLVFVDEYQDINAAQDRILACLARDGERANRFLVGDVKQSIYRFRQAAPHIFQDYAREWHTGRPHCEVIPLSDNFRSHESILRCINRVFESLMRSEVGGVSYDEDAQLRFGNRDERTALAVDDERIDPRTEFHLLLPPGDADESGENEEADVANLSRIEKEAHFVASRLRDLKAQGFQVWREAKQAFEPVAWGDMAVLLRSPRSRAEAFAHAFAKLEIPFEVERSGFYNAIEVRDLLNLLTVLDNPLQDIEALGVLRSPLVGLRVDELAVIRLGGKTDHYWEALLRFHGNPDGYRTRLVHIASALATVETAWPKVDRFLKTFANWRVLVRQGSIAACLESVLDETHYEDWLGARKHGARKQANVRRLLGMARSFDMFQRQGLFRFLNFVEAQQEAEAETRIAATGGADAVRLLSIHQSKGLEFPMVVLADLGSRLNTRDLSANLLLDEHYGVCTYVKPPGTELRYRSLPHWLAARRQRRELVGEELRLLYVAMTRAKDKLILVGTGSRKKLEEQWNIDPPSVLAAAHLLAAQSMLDWLGPLLPALCGTTDWAPQGRGRSALIEWRVGDDEDLAVTPVDEPGEQTVAPMDEEALKTLVERLNWQYPWTAATDQTAKRSVSEIRRRLAEADEDEEAAPFTPPQLRPATIAMHGRKKKQTLSAPEVGIAHHRFLQHAALERMGEINELREEAAALAGRGLLTEAQVAALDFAALHAFWASSVGEEIRANAAQVQRELPFTARFAPGEIQAGDVEGEFVVVQGVIDLAVILPDAIWIVDFKTDDVPEGALDEKLKAYRPQVDLYAAALQRIYQRPVTRRLLHFLTVRHTEEW